MNLSKNYYGSWCLAVHSGSELYGATEKKYKQVSFMGSFCTKETILVVTMRAKKTYLWYKLGHDS
jgi:hypothetical protein